MKKILQGIDRLLFISSPVPGMMISGGIEEKWAYVANFYQSYAMKGGNGEAEADSAEFEKTLGRKLTSLKNAVKEITRHTKYSFRSKSLTK